MLYSVQVCGQESYSLHVHIWAFINAEPQWVAIMFTYQMIIAKCVMGSDDIMTLIAMMM